METTTMMTKDSPRRKRRMAASLLLMSCAAVFVSGEQPYYYQTKRREQRRLQKPPPGGKPPPGERSFFFGSRPSYSEDEEKGTFYNNKRARDDDQYEDSSSRDYPLLEDEGEVVLYPRPRPAEGDNKMILTVHVALPIMARSRGHAVSLLVTHFLNDTMVRDDMNMHMEEPNGFVMADDEIIISMPPSSAIDDDRRLQQQASLQVVATHEDNVTLQAPTKSMEMIHHHFVPSALHKDYTRRVMWWQYNIHYECFWKKRHETLSDQWVHSKVTNQTLISEYTQHVSTFLSEHAYNGSVHRWAYSKPQMKLLGKHFKKKGHFWNEQEAPFFDIVVNPEHIHDLEREVPRPPWHDATYDREGDPLDESTTTDAGVASGFSDVGMGIPQGLVSPLDVHAWDWRRYLGLGLFLATAVSALILMQVAAYRQRRLDYHSVWSNLASQDGVEELLATQWNISGSRLEVYNRSGRFGYQESMLMGGYEQRVALAAEAMEGAEQDKYHPRSEAVTQTKAVSSATPDTHSIMTPTQHQDFDEEEA